MAIIDDPALAAAAPVGSAIIGDIKDAVATLLEARRRTPDAEGLRSRPTPPPPEPLTDAYVLSRLAALRTPASIIVEEAPSARGPMHDFLPILAPTASTPAPAAGSATACPPRSASRSAGPARR